MSMMPLTTTTVRTDYSALPPEGSQVTRAPWYAAYTFARHEKRVVQQLEERRIQSFLPTYRSVRRWKDRKKVLELPLFPSYVFVQMSANSRLQLLSLPGVLGLVCFQGKPAPVDSVEIEN